MLRSKSRSSTLRALIDVPSQELIQTCNEGSKEVWEVKEVPLNFEGFSKPSSAIERLLSKRRREHENVLKNTKDSIFIICEECNQHLQNLRKCLNMKIQNVQQTIQEKQNQFLDKNFSDITNEELSMIWDFVNNLVEKEKSGFDKNFKESVEQVQKNRRERSKFLFEDSLKTMKKISYLLPRDVEILIENEISNYNIMVLESHKAYECLHLEISLLFNTFLLNFENWMEGIKITRKEACRLKNLKMLKAKTEILKCAESLFLNNDNGKIAFSILRIKENLISDLLSHWKIVVPLSREILEEQFSEIEENILILEKDKASFLETYYLILKGALDEFCSEIQNFNEMYKGSITEEDDELINRMIENIKNEYESVLSTLEKEWKDIILKLKETVVETFGFLHKFALLWEKELSQIAELQNKILHSVESTTHKNNKANQSFDSKLKTEMRNIRQGINEETLKKQLNQINTYLNRFEEKLKSNFQEELKIIEKYDESMNREMSELENKINILLQINSPEKNIIQPVNNYFEKVEGEESIVLSQICLFGKEITSVLQWKSNVVENITLHRLDFVKNLKNQSESWKDGLISKCKKNLEIELELQDKRGKELLEIYEVRIKEIKSHNNRLEEHKKRVNEEIKEIPQKSITFWKNLENDFKNYEQEISEISEQCLKAEGTLKIRYLRTVINKKRRIFESHVKSEAETLITEIKNTFSGVNNRNEGFFKEIILFKDDGNFNFEEAKIIKKQLQNLKESIKKSESQTLTNFETTLTEILSKIDKSETFTIEKIGDTMQNLEFMEFVTNTVDKCSHSIEIKIRNLINSDEKLIQNFNNLVEVFNNKLIAQFPIKSMINDYMNLLEMICNQFKYLELPLPDFLKDEKNILFVSTLSTEEENNFSSHIVKIISNTFLKIQEKSSDYLSKMGKNSTSELEKVQQQLYSYYLDAKKVWTHEIKNFFCLVLMYKKMMQNWILTTITEYSDFTVQSIIAQKTDTIKIVNQIIKKGSETRNKNRQSVKVTHGFPKNRQVLENLNIKVQNEEKEIYEKLENIFHTSVEQFKELFNVYKAGLADIDEDISDVIDKLKTVNKILDMKFKLINTESEKSVCSLQSEVVLSFKYTEFRQIKIPKSSFIIKDLKFEETRNEIFDTKEIFEIESSIDLSSKIKVLLEKYIDKIDKVCSKATKELEVKIKKFLLERTEFLSWWQKNIEIVPEVYNVKYDSL